jgi:hypothetical protein
VPVVPRKVVKAHRPAGGSEERYGSTRPAGSALVQKKRSNLVETEKSHWQLAQTRDKQTSCDFDRH